MVVHTSPPPAPDPVFLASRGHRTSRKLGEPRSLNLGADQPKPADDGIGVGTVVAAALIYSALSSSEPAASESFSGGGGDFGGGGASGSFE